MKIALIGYGKMGREIERLALDRHIEVTAKFDKDDHIITKETMGDPDVAIHFALPATVITHIKACAQEKINMVIGTTGWNDQLDLAREIAKKNKIGLVYGSNFSIGMNLFFRLVERSAQIAKYFNEYDVFIHEAHHKDKIDSPSGTALSIAEIIMKSFDRKKEILTTSPKGAIRPEQLHISSSRGGAVVGDHTVTYDSAADSIELTHRAKDRSGFASGALLAAEWIVGKTGCYTMDDVFKDVLDK